VISFKPQPLYPRKEPPWDGLDRLHSRCERRAGMKTGLELWPLACPARSQAYSTRYSGFLTRFLRAENIGHEVLPLLSNSVSTSSWRRTEERKWPPAFLASTNYVELSTTREATSCVAIR
jgi:hypothetical protein